MGVRNFWIEADIDGQQNPSQYGPIGKDGGFTMKIYQRHNGESILAAEITGVVKEKGMLELWLEVNDSYDLPLGAYSESYGNGSIMFTTLR